MKKAAMALAATAGLVLAPANPLLAETPAAKETDAIAKAWVPATPAEKAQARGGGQSNTTSLWYLSNTYCNNVTIEIFFCRRMRD